MAHLCFRELCPLNISWADSRRKAGLCRQANLAVRRLLLEAKASQYGGGHEGKNMLSELFPLRLLLGPQLCHALCHLLSLLCIHIREGLPAQAGTQSDLRLRPAHKMLVSRVDHNPRANEAGKKNQGEAELAPGGGSQRGWAMRAEQHNLAG